MKERKPIEVIVKVETLKNGYSLDVDGKEYLYFDVVELAKGLILHAGLGRTSPTTKFGRDSLLKAIGNGSAEKKLQQEINKLQEEVTYLHNKLYGYKKFTDKVLLNEKLMELYKDMVLDNIPRGLSGCIYTQLSDVEDECNGLFTMDRQVTKVDTRKIKKMNEKLVRSLNK